MCVESPGVPPLLAADRRGPADRITPEELTSLGAVSAGWVSRPKVSDGAAASPIVVVCHERYGVVQHTVDLAEKFAAAGFLAVAPDFYADMTLTGDEATLPAVPDESVLRHLEATIRHAKGLPCCGKDSPVAVIGICRSGSYGILASAERADIAAVVMLYGGAQPREFKTGALRSRPYQELVAAGTAPVLGLWGERDHTMSIDDVRRVRDLLEDAKRSYEFIIYPDLPHGWLNDTMPGRFRSAEAQETFDTITNWLHDTMRADKGITEVSWRFRSLISTEYDFSANERLH